MNSAAGAPGGIDRRAFRGLSLVPQSLPAKALKTAIDDAVAVKIIQDVFIECSSRNQLIGLLDRQVSVSQQVKRPISLVLVDLTNSKTVAPDQTGKSSPIYLEAFLHVVAKIFRAKLRPADFIIRPSKNCLGLVLLDAEASGARAACIRLNAAIERPISFGKGSMEISAKFGLSEQYNGFGSAGESLLVSAEMALSKAFEENQFLVIAQPTNGPQPRNPKQSLYFGADNP
jgi:GGDEF domain-containing protein